MIELLPIYAHSLKGLAAFSRAHQGYLVIMISSRMNVTSFYCYYAGIVVDKKITNGGKKSAEIVKMITTSFYFVLAYLPEDLDC